VPPPFLIIDRSPIKIIDTNLAGRPSQSSTAPQFIC